MLDIAFYSFKHPENVSCADLEKCGIKSLVDVGNWLVAVLKNRFKQDDLATNLKEFIGNNC